MNTPPSRFVPTLKSTYAITVSGYDNKCLSGTLYSPLTQKTYRFENLMQFLRLTEALMDEGNFPQRGVEPRAFQAVHETVHPQECAAETGTQRLATFNLNILFRQNASWQGVIVWNEQMLESHFRSTLELIGLIDDALSAEA